MRADRPPPLADDALYPAYVDAVRARAADPSARWRTFGDGAPLPRLDLAVSAAAVASSRIEGIDVDLDTYLASKARGALRQRGAGPVQRVSALERAYRFARGRALTEANALEAHALLTAASPTLGPSDRGRYRDGRVAVTDAGGLVFMPAEAGRVPAEMATLFDDAGRLLARARAGRLPVRRAFFYAARLHLLFVQVHPYFDGNGRAGRLLEKWFLASALGPKAWRVPSEEFYERNRMAYYGALQMGRDFHFVRYAEAVPFLTMLPAALVYGIERSRR